MAPPPLGFDVDRSLARVTLRDPLPRLRTVLPFALAGLALCACGGSSPDSSSDTTTGATTSQSTTSIGGNGGVAGTSSTTGASTTGGGTTGGSASGGTTGGFTQAAHEPPATLVSSGGPVMSGPEIAPVMWQGDPNAARVGEFLSHLPSSQEFLDALAPYGLQSLTCDTPQPTSSAVPSTYDDAQLRSDLRAAIAANPNVSPAALANAIFTFVIPQATAFTLSAGGQNDTLCVQLGGYHSFLTLSDGTRVIYAVVGECALPAPYPDVIDATTVFLTNELAEAITDPQAEDVDPADGAAPDPAYYTPSELSWFYVFHQGEVADLCGYPFTYFVDSAGFMRQHLWNNAAALAGQDPCGAPIYLGAAPPPGVVQPLPLSGLPAGFQASGLTIAVGSSATIPLQLFSSAPHDAWTVKAIDAAQLAGGSPDLSVSLSGDTGQNGDTLQLSITVNRKGTVGTRSGLEGVVVYSQPSDGSAGGSMWPILVYSP